MATKKMTMHVPVSDFQIREYKIRNHYVLVECKKAICGDNHAWKGIEECDNDDLFNRTCETIYGPG